MSIFKNNWFRFLIFWPVIVSFFAFITGFLVDLYMSKYYPNHVSTFDLPIDHNYAAAFLYSCSFFLINRNTAVWSLKRYPVSSLKYIWKHIGIQVGSALFAFIVGTLLNGVIFRSKDAFDGSLPFFVFVFAISMFAAFVINVLFYMAHFYHNMIKQEKNAAEHQLSALKNQINPHFLFNSLNSIASLIRINPEKAEEVTEDLAELYRYSLRAGKKHLTNLREEIDSVHTYFRIEKARFGKRVQLVIHVDETLLETPLPSLILQPLVENAIKHGANNMLDICEIKISAELKNQHIEICVSDNGPGFKSTNVEDLFGDGTGLKNVNDRLEFVFGKKSALQISKNSVLFSVPILLENK